MDQEPPTLWSAIYPELRCSTKHATQQNMRNTTDISSRVRHLHLIPLTEPYVRTSYTAHVHFHSA
ncbi:hypothetical protein CTM89_10125 [Photobacterium leiognathi]|uniref:Uncharacterized protein n=1 Tax=Photobacterium leiognathi TaxID=553611 RepID=A0A2T3MBQ6_PHOLE|nr:hypothetical protein CTM89_10125 [Photobacterium leiognathi]